jgi:DNA-binding SARP family transcriptional activator
MSGINFNFNRGIDPLLGSTADYQAHLAELENAQALIDQKRQALLKMAEENPQQTTKSATPIWDEIDTITANMSQAEFQTMSENENYKASLEALMAYVGAVQLEMIRPRIEQSAEGKKLLEQHLTNVRYLRKEASANVDKKLSDFEDYTKNYSHMSWDEYLKTKGGKK